MNCINTLVFYSRTLTHTSHEDFVEMFIFNIYFISFMLVSILRSHMVTSHVPWQDIYVIGCVSFIQFIPCRRRECLPLPLQVL